jgi:hypothetical protein
MITVLDIERFCLMPIVEIEIEDIHQSIPSGYEVIISQGEHYRVWANQETLSIYVYKDGELELIEFRTLSEFQEYLEDA